jgi:divalent metal cation (Fe/Co/Zn/Cd) transporter
VHGLLDRALAEPEQGALAGVLARHAGPEVQFHALRTRQAGARRFVTFHVLVPGDWTVRHGHALCEQVELEIAAVVPNATVLTHLEALEDPASFRDQGLDREPPAPAAGGPEPGPRSRPPA